jgi:preprotein translocase subunit SecD
VNLGLDLRGGAHLLAEVRVSDVYADRIDGMWPEVRDRLRDERALWAQCGACRRMIPANCGCGSQIPRPQPIRRPVLCAIWRSPCNPCRDWQARSGCAGDGDHIIVTLSEAERIATDDRTMRQSLEIIRRRVDEVGTREPTIQRQGEDRILIQVPGIGSAAELKALIGTTARLTFHPVVRVTSNPDEARARAR